MTKEPQTAAEPLTGAELAIQTAAAAGIDVCFARVVQIRLSIGQAWT